jgi:hypothetical protein
MKRKKSRAREREVSFCGESDDIGYADFRLPSWPRFVYTIRVLYTLWTDIGKVPKGKERMYALPQA